MRIEKYGILMILSAICLSIGGFDLYIFKKVPLILSLLTIIAIFIILLFSILILKIKKRLLVGIGGVLAIVSFAISLNQSHIMALLNVSSEFEILPAILGMVLGFYIFPGLYIIFMVIDYLKGDFN
ncbi:hypothetical protein [Caldiplasma sukawensis]